MIDFRYHIVSIVAVFLALATGIALGTGPLKSGVDHQIVQAASQDRAERQHLRNRLADLGATQRFQDEFAGTVAPSVLHGALSGRAVSLLVLPRVPDSTVSALTSAIGQAGGQLTSTVRLTFKLVDPANRGLVDQLSDQLLSGVRDVAVPDSASSYQRAGAVLARALLTMTAGGEPTDNAAKSILSGFSVARLVESSTQPERRASLAVIVTGGPFTRSSTPAPPGESDVIAELASALDFRCGGVVLAGTPEQARDDGAVQVVRADDAIAGHVSTVDMVNTPAGQAATVLALAQQARGQSGQYGAVDATDGALPPITAGSG